MLKLGLKPGQYIQLGDNVKVIYSGGTSGNIELLVDAPRSVAVVRSELIDGAEKFYGNKVSDKARKEIGRIMAEDKKRAAASRTDEAVKEPQRYSEACRERIIKEAAERYRKAELS